MTTTTTHDEPKQDASEHTLTRKPSVRFADVDAHRVDVREDDDALLDYATSGDGWLTPLRW